MKGILVDDNGDLMVSNGHLSVGDNRMQCARHLTGAYTGEFKHEPTLGGNAGRMIAGTPDPFWAGEMRKQLSRCNIGVNSISIEDKTITLELND